MSNTSNPQPWWKSTDPNKGMQQRVAEIHKMRDPGTFADEVLKGSKFLFFLSLAFTGTLCFFSYSFFLERFLSPEATLVAAVAITVLIEYGKQRIGMNAIRMPFLQGWRYITSTAENTFMFLGSALFAIAVFSISVYNSTNGAARYAQQTAEQKTEANFVADTKYYDEQIAAHQKTIDAAPTYKWKKQTYYQSPKSVNTAIAAKKELEAAREKARAEQRADFERSRDKSDAANTHSGQIALRIGGWLELLQVLLMFLMASCERVLDRRSSPEKKGSTAPPHTQPANIGFKQQPVVSNQNNPVDHTDPLPIRQQIGYHRYEQPAAQPQISVPQTAQPVQRDSRMLFGEEADKTISYHLSLLKKEPSNFSNKHANPETVARRIHTKLDSLTNTMKWVEWCSKEKALEVVNYINESIWPHLVEHGFTYDLKELYSLFNQKGTGGPQYHA